MAEKLSNEQKKELAKLLYTKEGLTVQKELAARVGVSEKTMSKWINNENWEVLRSSLIVTKEEQLRRLYMQLTELNDLIMKRESGFRFSNTKEADVISKLTASIRQLETESSIADVIEVAKGFIQFVRVADLPKAQEITNLFDAYIKKLINEASR